MIKIEEFFSFTKECIVKTDHGHSISWKVPENLPYFEGHFPDNPVLPAIALIDYISASFSFTHNASFNNFTNIKSAKFSNIVRPNDLLNFDFSYNSKTQFWNANITNQEQLPVSRVRFQLSGAISSTNL